MPMIRPAASRNSLFRQAMLRSAPSARRTIPSLQASASSSPSRQARKAAVAVARRRGGMKASKSLPTISSAGVPRMSAPQRLMRRTLRSRRSTSSITPAVSKYSLARSRSRRSEASEERISATMTRISNPDIAYSNRLSASDIVGRSSSMSGVRMKNQAANPPVTTAVRPGPVPPASAATMMAGNRVAKGTTPATNEPRARRTHTAPATQTTAKTCAASAFRRGLHFPTSAKIRPVGIVCSANDMVVGRALVPSRVVNAPMACADPCRTAAARRTARDTNHYAGG